MMSYFRFPRPLLILCTLTFVLPVRAQENSVAANESSRRESEPRRVNGIAAKVNGEVITLNELMIKVAPLQSVLMTRYPRRGPAYRFQLEQLRSSILDELIDRTIIFSEFKDRINAIPEHRIEAEVKRIVNDVYKGDEELFRAYLKETNLTRDQFKQQQRREILVQIVKSQHFGDVPNPREEELREEYDKWRITNRDRSQDFATYRRIYLLKNARGGPEAQLLLAERLVEKIKNGGDFPSLAKLYSNDTHAEEGGLWKDVARKDLSMEFGAILFETEGNEVIGPIDDTRGYNIIKVIERKLGPAKPFEEVRDELTQQVISQKKKGNFEKWMKKMRSRADIQKML
jgi:parvulin-like peptidyl-prolyl isomerase